MIVDDLRAFPIRAFLRIKLQSRTPAVLLPGKVSGNTFGSSQALGRGNSPSGRDGFSLSTEFPRVHFLRKWAYGIEGAWKPSSYRIEERRRRFTSYQVIITLTASDDGRDRAHARGWR